MDTDDEFPPEVIELIKVLITRPEVQSVSFPYSDERVWRALVREQLKRAEGTGRHRQNVFGLSGPDSGLPFDPADWGGYVHIPYEGMAEADLFVKSPTRGFHLPYARGGGDLKAAMLGKHCHHALVHGEHRDVDGASRTLVQGWTLYTSNRPYVRCMAFANVKRTTQMKDRALMPNHTEHDWI